MRMRQSSQTVYRGVARDSRGEIVSMFEVRGYRRARRYARLFGRILGINGRHRLSIADGYNDSERATAVRHTTDIR